MTNMRCGRPDGPTDELVREMTARIVEGLNRDMAGMADASGMLAVTDAPANSSTSAAVTVDSLRETMASLPKLPGPPSGKVWFARGTVDEVMAGVPRMGLVGVGLPLEMSMLGGLDVVQVGPYVLIGDWDDVRKVLEKDGAEKGTAELLAELRQAESAGIGSIGGWMGSIGV